MRQTKITSHLHTLTISFSSCENDPFPDPALWIQARATRVARPVKEKRTFFVLALTGMEWDRSPGPTPFRSTHVTSLFHADVRLVRTEDEMVEHRDADKVPRFM